ncbi:MAG: hypothetical protein ILM98_03975 [Kiritimatiellae bacterium]|nr:hypothetical protein [Kiritimatiellia bacterium]
MNKSQKSKVESPRSKVCALAVCAVAAVATIPLRALAELPDDYLDYVESSGSQYIDTGVAAKSGTRMVAEMEWVSKPSVQSTFCGASDGSTYVVTPYTSAGESHQVGYAKNSQYQVGGSGKPNPDIRFRVETTFEIGSQTFNVRALDGSGYNATRTYNDSAIVDLGYPLYIFARNDAGTANQYSSARIFSLMLWQKDGNGDWQLVRHFLPCRKDGRAALYDKVNETIHYPQGGDLVASSILPRPTAFVEWVQSDGADGDRQLYIDTGVPAKAGVGMVADMEWVTKPTTNFFCGATGDDGARFWLYYAEPNGGVGNATHKFGYNSWRMQISGGGNSPTVGVRYRIDSFLARSPVGAAISNQVLSVQSLTGAAYHGSREWNDAAEIDTQRSLYLFANNCAGAAGSNICARLYSLVLTNELGVVRDFIPCVADNGKAGLYDTVSERIFFPQAAADGATAEFSLATEVGAVTNHPATTKWPIERPEWIEANGTNDYVNLGIIGQDGMRMAAEMEWSFIPASAATFCGSATNSSAGLFTTYRVTPDFHRIGYYNGSSTLGGASCAPVAEVRYRVETSLKNGEQIISVAKFENGVWSPVGNGTRTVDLSFPAGYADLGIPLYLFARNLNGVADEFAPARLYSFKLWQGDSLVRDLAPVFDPADNSPALFDKVEKRYYHNDGGYRLTAGGATTAFPGAASFWIMK